MKQLAIILAIVTTLGGGLVLYQKNQEAGLDDTQENAQQQIVQAEEDTHEKATETTCVSDECLNVEDLEYPVGTLPQTVIEALRSALDDEYKAFATYDAVISQFGSSRPFSMIIRAEESHIASLKSLFDKYGIAIPENEYVGSVEVASSLGANCSVGVQAEIVNAALYREELLPAVAEYSDITSVFTRLMNASQDKHLPAFQTCAG